MASRSLLVGAPASQEARAHDHGGGVTRRYATRVVAAANSLASSRAAADYVCDGVADDVEINTAFADMGGLAGRVVLLEGDFTLAAPVTVPVNCSLMGQGQKATRLSAVAGSTAAQLVFGANDCEIGHLYLNAANLPAGADGIELRPGGHVAYVDIHNAPDNGISMLAGFTDVFIFGCRIFNAAGTGIYGESSVVQTTPRIIGNQLFRCQFSITLAPNAVTTSAFIVGNLITDAQGGAGILLLNQRFATVHDNYMTTQPGSGQSAINLASNCTACSVQNNVARGNTGQWNHGVTIVGSSNFVTNNDFFGCYSVAAVNDAGVGTVTAPGNRI